MLHRSKPSGSEKLCQKRKQFIFNDGSPATEWFLQPNYGSCILHYAKKSQKNAVDEDSDDKSVRSDYSEGQACQS
jgi:hypothetical protein